MRFINNSQRKDRFKLLNVNKYSVLGAMMLLLTSCDKTAVPTWIVVIVVILICCGLGSGR